MRILVISDLPAFVTGGAEMQAARLIQAWLDAGHEVRCLGRRMGKGPVRLGSHILAVHRIRTTSLFGRYGRAVSYFFSLAWLLLRHVRWTDVVYTRFLGEAAATCAALKAVNMMDCPLVATPANTRGDGDTNLLVSLPFGARLIALLDRQCDAINLIAPDMAEELRAAGFSGKNFTHIPNGIPLEPMPAVQARSSAGPRFIAVGRLAPQKGYDILLHAISINRGRAFARQFSIIGDGPERKRLRELACKLGVDPLIDWHGEVVPQNVRPLLAASDVFVLPSRYEGMSNAGLEAMECGLPLLLSRCGGLDLYIDRDMGWVVPPGDIDALATAMSDAMSCPAGKLAAMGQRARSAIENHFDMQVIAARHLVLFAHLRAGKSVEAWKP